MTTGRRPILTDSVRHTQRKVISPIAFGYAPADFPAPMNGKLPRVVSENKFACSTQQHIEEKSSQYNLRERQLGSQLAFLHKEVLR